jgi:thiamine-monophosphate kinase
LSRARPTGGSISNKPLSLTDLGELGVIGLFQELLAGRSPAGLTPEIGIGDDAAVWRPTPGRLALETTDLLIEEVHFSLRHMTWYDVGWKALAVNGSDIAAMGGIPRAAFVSAGLRPGMPSDEAAELYRGLGACANEYGVCVMGGDTVASPQAAIVNVALYGESLDDSGAVLRRDRARPGDAVAVSGPLGASAAYLQLQDEALRAAHVHPLPRVELGQQLLGAGIACAMDLSDGLLADLGKLCRASGAGAVIEAARVPIAPEVARLLPAQALELALTGGEDYELLACGADDILRQQGMLIVGRVEGASGVRVVDEAGTEIVMQRRGYDAFLP